MRNFVAAGAAALVLGLGGNLYATSYTMPNTFGFETGPPSSFSRTDVVADFLPIDFASYQHSDYTVVFDHLRQIVSDHADRTNGVGHANGSRRRGHTAHTQSVSTVSVEPVGTPTSVPDGGTTALMLGGALCGLFALRRHSVA